MILRFLKSPIINKLWQLKGNRQENIFVQFHRQKCTGSFSSGRRLWLVQGTWILQLWLFQLLTDNSRNFVFQQDEAFPSLEHSHSSIPERWASASLDCIMLVRMTVFLPCHLTRFPDLRPCYFLLWRHIKVLVYILVYHSYSYM